MKKDLVAWGAAIVLFVIGDTEATMWAVESPHMDELNPLMAPFVKRGRKWVYAVKLIVGGAVAYKTGFDRDIAVTFAGFGAGAVANNLVGRLLLDWLR